MSGLEPESSRVGLWQAMVRVVRYLNRFIRPMRRDEKSAKIQERTAEMEPHDHGSIHETAHDVQHAVEVDV